MKFERINENSISCTLTSFDLSVRNLNIRELAYGSEKARKLFEEMMNKASAEVGFNADGTPIMIEAIPMGGDSIKLIISKVTDPEELDARFSRFTRGSGSGSGRREAENWLSRLASFLLEGAGELAGEAVASADTDKAAASRPEQIEGTVKGSDNGNSTQSRPRGRARQAAAARTAPEFRAFAFENLDTVISACRAAYSYQGESILYRMPSGEGYVLVIRTAGHGDEGFARCSNSIAEYGRMIRTVQNTLVYYEEHYETVVAEDAVHKLAVI